jgi:uncharacterized protein involved in outer membrane biogenesis
MDLQLIQNKRLANPLIRYTFVSSKNLNIMKKLFKGLFILLLLLIIAAVAIPYFFKDKIIARVKSDINKNINATVDFKEVDLSLFKSFPDFYFGMNDFTITGKEPFEGMEMVNVGRMELDLNLMSVFQKTEPIQINAVNLVKPKIHIVVLRDGKANYDIVQNPDTTQTTEYAFLIKLKEYAIKEGDFIYDDRQGGTYLELKNLNHRGQGDFTQDVFDFVTKTTIGELTARSGGIAYLSKVRTEADITFKADLPNNTYTLKDNEVKLNALSLKTDGSIQLAEEAINLDLTFSSPGNDFKHFLSLIPNAYTKDYANIKTSGKLQLDGLVKGAYTEKAMPSFKVNLKIDEASFKYPELPMGVNGINADIAINSPTSNLDNMVIDISKFNFELGNNPMAGYFKLKSPISDPDIDTKINGTLNFADLAKAFPMDGVKSLTGILKADVTANTRLSTIDKGDYEAVNMSGILQFNKVNYEAVNMPPVLVEELSMNFTPQKVIVSKFLSKLGKSDLRASGEIDNILAIISPEKTMKGRLEVESNYFDANEWLSGETTTDAVPVAEAETKVFDQFDFLIKANFRALDYDIYKLKNLFFDGKVAPSQVKIDRSELQIGESDLKMTGVVNNVFPYLYDNEILRGELVLNSEYLDLNPFMVEETAPATGEAKAQKIADPATTAVLRVPERMDISVNANLKKVKYTNLDMKNLTGVVKVKDEVASLDGFKADLLGGSMNLTGTYDTKEPAKPIFDIDYGINNFRFKEAFNYLNTVKAFAPIAEYIDGNFNTTFKMKGALTDEMLPDMKSLTIAGFLQTLNGTLQGFEPLKKANELLNIKALNNFNLKDTKNWFDIVDGKFILKEFDYKYQGIDMVMGGTHGLDQDMDYTILAKIPRSMWTEGATGKTVGKGLDFLQGEAGKLGVNLDIGDFIDVQIKVLGSIKNPQVKVKPLGSGGKSLKDTAKDMIKDVVDQKKEEVLQKVDEKKEDLLKKADEEKAKLKAKADAEIAKVMAEAKKNADKIKSEAAKLAETTKKEGYAQADKLVEAAGSNPIKKAAAKKSAEILKKETDKKAAQIVAEGNKRADQAMKKAEEESEKIRKKYQ